MTNAESHQRSPAPHDHVLFADLDGEGVLVDLNSKQYFQLNDTASFIWRQLASGRSPAEIAREMTAVYDVTPERAEAGVEAAVRAFGAQGLLATTR